MKNDRLFQLLYLLLEHGTMTAPQLAEAMEVSVRTVYRDVETLSMAGVPVSATSGKNGGIALVDGYAFSKALLSDREQEEILFALQSLRATGQHTDALAAKLSAVFQKSRTSWIEVDFSRWGFGQTDGVKFEALRRAILERRILRIRYCGVSSSTAPRRVEPVKLIYKDKSWYLQAFCLMANDFRLFKINRILELTPTDGFFPEALPPAPPVEPPMPPSDLLPLTLRFSSQAAFRVYDEFESGGILLQPDGSLQVHAEFPVGDWILGYLFSFGTDVTVLSPQSLREELAAHAGKIYRHHQT